MTFDFNLDNLTTLFREIGLYNSENQFYHQRIRKREQIFAYIPQISAAFRKLSTKRPIVMLDCGCGKSYLSFVLYQYCTTVLKRKIKIIGVDNNAELIDKCNHSAKELGFANMQFYNFAIETFGTNDAIDIAYSLHACDLATDQTIAKGVQLDAKYIFSVSCCQHANRAKMSKHPLTSVSRYQPYKERLVDMLGDSMRALLLERLGYGVNIFEFVAAEKTPKNIMLRAVKNAVRKRDQIQAAIEYKRLVKMFNFAPKLEEML
ncbi:MAG: SAM-dependent methyltransferase [Gammaproteobacteria bacterium]|jgi:SAM-dependent methyltransferase